MPRPSDFDLFWKDRMVEADAVGLDYAIEAASVTDAVTCQLFVRARRRHLGGPCFFKTGAFP